MLCATNYTDSGNFSAPVVALLIGAAFSCVIQSTEIRALHYVLCASFILLGFADICFFALLPLIFFDISRHKLYPLFMLPVLPLIYHIGEGGSIRLMLSTLVFCLAAVTIEMLDSRMNRLRHELIVTRDTAVEDSNELKEKNRRIIEAQDAEVHLATLKERNRIAREIHDNVGHMLTRTILQTGALQIINKDENLKEPLESIKTTLDEAMTQVRKSVHDLHDESVDLEASLKEAVAPLYERFGVTLEIDVTGPMEGRLKYCFIAIVKEAVNNIIKHSKGDAARIILREHPAMYTLGIEDNGRCEEGPLSGGIGLENMRERVEAQGGVININPGRDGFKIFVNIMKKAGTKA